MNNVVGKISRVLLVVTLFSIISLVLALLFVTFLGFLYNTIFQHNVIHSEATWLLALMFKNLHHIAILVLNVVFELIILVCKNIIFLPVVFMCLAVLLLILLQARRTRKIKKMILMADNMPNSYKFEAPKTVHPRTSLILKIALAISLVLIFTICNFAQEIAEFSINPQIVNVILPLLNGFSFIDILSSISYAFEIITCIIYVMLFSSIKAACVVGIFVVFTGGRSEEVKELSETIEQKSRFAKIREMEESDEIDELSQLF